MTNLHSDLQEAIRIANYTAYPKFPTLKKSGHLYVAVMTDGTKSHTCTFGFNPDTWASKDMTGVISTLLHQMGYNVNPIGGAELAYYALDSILAMESVSDVFHAPESITIMEPQKHIVIKGDAIRYSEPPTEEQKAKRSGVTRVWKNPSKDITLVIMAVSEWIDENTTRENNALVQAWFIDVHKSTTKIIEKAQAVLKILDGGS